MPANWADDVLTFWFDELGPKDWFAKSDNLDTTITQRFGSLHSQLASQSEDRFLESPMVALAAIILFDQFSRNLFRDDPLSFASDPLALTLAHNMVAREWDQKIALDRRIFVYLPFEHSEALKDQDTAIELIAALGDEQFTRYAHAHRDVIDRFGRFPHRNVILGRASTPEEERYLSQPGSGF